MTQPVVSYKRHRPGRHTAGKASDEFVIRPETIIWLAIGTVVACCGCVYSWIYHGGYHVG